MGKRNFVRTSFGEDILKDIREFVQFFRSLWGLLAGGSLFFPFMNLFVEALPYPDESIRKECATFALLTSAFVFLIVYMSRLAVFRFDSRDWTPRLGGQYWQLPLAGHRSTLAAGLSFSIFVIVFLTYLRTVFSNYYHFGDWSLERGVFTYGLVFALATLSFTLLATAEYMKQIKERENVLRQGSPTPDQARRAIFDRLPKDERPAYEGELRVVQESLIEEGGRILRFMTAQSTLGRRYEVKVDRQGTVYHFERWES